MKMLRFTLLYIMVGIVLCLIYSFAMHAIERRNEFFKPRFEDPLQDTSIVIIGKTQ
jgi:hypothetical protein